MFNLYASTRVEELAAARWDEKQQRAFLIMQFDAQTQHYRNAYPQMESQIILHDGKPAGRFLVARLTNEIRVVDIALFPEHCNKGIGTTLINSLLGEGRRTGMPVRLHVEVFNRARSLYERLGFREVSMNGVYILMEWLPDVTSTVRSAKLAEVSR